MRSGFLKSTSFALFFSCMPIKHTRRQSSPATRRGVCDDRCAACPPAENFFASVAASDVAQAQMRKLLAPFCTACGAAHAYRWSRMRWLAPSAMAVRRPLFHRAHANSSRVAHARIPTRRKRPRTFDQQTDRPHVAHRPTITRDGCDSDDIDSVDRCSARRRPAPAHASAPARKRRHAVLCSVGEPPPARQKNGRSDERPSGCSRRRDQCASSSSSSA